MNKAGMLPVIAGVLMATGCGGGSSDVPTLSSKGFVQWSANGHWYRAVAAHKAITWNAAEQVSESFGGHLVTITSQAENDFVYSLVNDLKYWNGNYYGRIWAGPWIGAIRLNANSPAWSWISGEPFNFSAWDTGEPNNDHGAETVAMFVYFGDKKWNDWKPDNAIYNEGLFPVTSYIIEVDGLHPPK